MLRGRISDIDGLAEALSRIESSIPTPGGTVVSNEVIQRGTVTANSAGTFIPFDVPYVGEYYFDANGQKSGAKVDVVYGNATDGTMAAGGCTVYPAEDGTTVKWIAVGGTA